MQRQNGIVRQNGYAPMRTIVHKHRKTTVKKKYKAVWALRLTDMSKDYVTLLSLNLLLCVHLLNISERLLMLVRKSVFKIANFSSKHRLQDLACRYFVYHADTFLTSRKTKQAVGGFRLLLVFTFYGLYFIILK